MSFLGCFRQIRIYLSPMLLKMSRTHPLYLICKESYIREDVEFLTTGTRFLAPKSCRGFVVSLERDNAEYTSRAGIVVSLSKTRRYKGHQTACNLVAIQTQG